MISSNFQFPAFLLLDGITFAENSHESQAGRPGLQEKGERPIIVATSGQSTGICVQTQFAGKVSSYEIEMTSISPVEASYSEDLAEILSFAGSFAEIIHQGNDPCEYGSS